MNALFAGLKTLGPVRLAALGAVGIAVLGVIVFLAARAGQPPMALLYGELDQRDAAQIVAALERQRIPYRLGGNGTQIMVPTDQVPRLRLSLASEGLPAGGSVGYEIFDRADGLTASSFQQNMNHLRALEGELARTIRSIHGVRAARVHLVLPRRDPFSRREGEAQASIVLTMAGVQRLDREQVQAIVHLVAAAVPGLKPQHISVVDNRGSLLARSGQAVGEMGLALNAEEMRRAHEIRLGRAIEEMLERTLGVGRVRAEVAAEMDFDRVTESRESFDPDQQVARSVQTVTEESRTTERNDNVTVGNNLPNPQPQQAQAGSQESRTEETTNYEIGRITRQIVRDTPMVRRLSVAVLVDHAPAGPGEEPRARTPEEIERIATLVRSAVGFNAERGDRVEVVNLRFADAAAAPAEPETLFGLPIGRAEIVRVVETVVFGIVALLALLLVARPLAGRALERIGQAEASGGSALAGPPEGIAALPAPAGAPALAEAHAGMAALAAPSYPALPAEERESMINIAQIEGQMRASSIRRVAELAEKHPEEAVSVVRGWMAQES
ncbi:flagellar basal-body MS-ring/collar protein FliF [Elioraea sp.]|uniref:flagellar basal-body MS-ring/collar protein FliF n=1 Tax=Elioraea sp. TaxID=2185103 RepID=UPI0021DCEACD|nr:flagellar basal-body MS-ring/collar protein FliF [Elioraea sp.]GIX10074.1 MAG: flagellar M-ring protein [Elioraea sp.]